jgi:hypothetical protein
VDAGCAHRIKAIESGLLEEQTIVKHDAEMVAVAGFGMEVLRIAIRGTRVF